MWWCGWSWCVGVGGDEGEGDLAIMPVGESLISSLTVSRIRSWLSVSCDGRNSMNLHCWNANPRCAVAACRVHTPQQEGRNEGGECERCQRVSRMPVPCMRQVEHGEPGDLRGVYEDISRQDV